MARPGDRAGAQGEALRGPHPVQGDRTEDVSAAVLHGERNRNQGAAGAVHPDRERKPGEGQAVHSGVRGREDRRVDEALPVQPAQQALRGDGLPGPRSPLHDPIRPQLLPGDPGVLRTAAGVHAAGGPLEGLGEEDPGGAEGGAVEAAYEEEEAAADEEEDGEEGRSAAAELLRLPALAGCVREVLRLHCGEPDAVLHGGGGEPEAVHQPVHERKRGTHRVAVHGPQPNGPGTPQIRHPGAHPHPGPPQLHARVLRQRPPGGKGHPGDAQARGGVQGPGPQIQGTEHRAEEAGRTRRGPQAHRRRPEDGQLRGVQVRGQRDEGVRNRDVQTGVHQESGAGGHREVDLRAEAEAEGEAQPAAETEAERGAQPGSLQHHQGLQRHGGDPGRAGEMAERDRGQHVLHRREVREPVGGLPALRLPAVSGEGLHRAVAAAHDPRVDPAAELHPGAEEKGKQLRARALHHPQGQPAGQPAEDPSVRHPGHGRNRKLHGRYRRPRHHQEGHGRGHQGKRLQEDGLLSLLRRSTHRHVRHLQKR